MRRDSAKKNAEFSQLASPMGCPQEAYQHILLFTNSTSFFFLLWRCGIITVLSA